MVATGSQWGDSPVRSNHMSKEEGRNIISIMYTNVDGIISSILELRDYIRKSKPDVVCLTETKLKEEIQLHFQKEGYNMWRRDRKEKTGGGVLILAKDSINVEEVDYGEGAVELVSIVIRNNDNERRRIIVAYVPPKTNA